MNGPVYVTRKEFRRYVRGALAAFCIMLSGVGYVLSTKPDTEAQRTAFIEACNNENILHAQSNITALVSFKILSLSGQRNKEARAILWPEARKLRITGLSDCVEATDNSKRYNYPVANPIGDPTTGEPSAQVQAIVVQSRRLLKETELQRPGG